MNSKTFPALPIWQQALLHAALVWVGLMILDTGFYSYRIATEGNFLFYEDGSPVTVWQRFTEAAWRWETLVFLAVAAGVELIYHSVFKKKSIKVFLIACVLFSSAFVGVLLLATHHQVHIRTGDLLVGFLEIFAYAVFYALARNFITRQTRAAEQISHQTQAELDALKAQLNPHFFFNTLNNLYGTALEEKAERTAQSVEQLSGIMRYVLTEAQQNFTDVSNEIRFLEDYLQLQQIRLPKRENIRIQTALVYDGKPALMAPLLLIPFVENAFKYGLSVDRDCYVQVTLEVKNQQLDLTVENLVFPDRQLDKGAGTGIAHVRKRLELLYPQRHQLEIQQNGQFKVRLQLTLR